VSPPHPPLGERPTLGVSMQGKMAKIHDLEGSVTTGGGTALARGGLAQVEADAADILPCVDGSCVNEAMPWPENASDGEAPAPGPLRGPGFRPPEDATLGAMASALGSSHTMDFRANELGLSGYPRAPPLSASSRQVEGAVELTCSQVAAASQLLKEMLATVGRDVLHPTQVSPKTKRRIFTGVSLALSGFPDFLPLLTFLRNAWPGTWMRWWIFRRR
jgi:hypothetical protein